MRIGQELTTLIKAVNALEEARKDCEYDQSYFLHRQIQDVEDAETAFLQALMKEIKNAPAAKENDA